MALASFVVAKARPHAKRGGTRNLALDGPRALLQTTMLKFSA
jgi:hypothetical protein